jgi:hypothetical protein
VAPPFPDAGPSLAVAFLEPLPGATFTSGSNIQVTAEVQAIGSPVKSCVLRLGDTAYNPQPTPTWTLANSFDAGTYELQVVVENTAGDSAQATRTIAIIP